MITLVNVAYNKFNVKRKSRKNKYKTAPSFDVISYYTAVLVIFQTYLNLRWTLSYNTLPVASKFQYKILPVVVHIPYYVM